MYQEQTRRVTERERENDKSGRCGNCDRGQVRGGLATLSWEFDFTVIRNRKARWSRLIIQPVSTVYELDPRGQSQKLSQHLGHE